MPINVQYQPNYGLIGALSALGSASQFAQDRDLQYDRMRLQAELAKRQMFNQNVQQQRSIDAQQQMALFNRQANLEQQGIDWQQRMAQAGLQNYLQQQDNQARLLYGQQQAQAAMAKEQYEQQQMGERMKMLREMDLAAQRDQEEARMAREQQMNELNFRSKAGEMEFQTQMGFEKDLAQLQLNPEGQTEKQKLYEELNRIRAISDDWRASDLQQALGQWRRNAAKLWDPQYTSPPKDWKATVPERAMELTPGVWIYKKENGEEEILGRPKDDSGSMAVDDVMNHAMKIYEARTKDTLGSAGTAPTLEAAVQEALEARKKIIEAVKQFNEQPASGATPEGEPANNVTPPELPPAYVQDGTGKEVVNPYGYKIQAEQAGPQAVLKTNLAELDPSAVPPDFAPAVINMLAQDLHNAQVAYGNVTTMPPQMRAAVEALIEGYQEMLAIHQPEGHQAVYQMLQQALANLQGTQAPAGKTTEQPRPVTAGF